MTHHHNNKVACWRWWPLVASFVVITSQIHIASQVFAQQLDQQQQPTTTTTTSSTSSISSSSTSSSRTITPPEQITTTSIGNAAASSISPAPTSLTTIANKLSTSCLIMGREYKHGEILPEQVAPNNPGCEKVCTCQNGSLLCQPICAESFDSPPPELNCSLDQAYKTTDDCCPKWLCPITEEYALVDFKILPMNSTTVEINFVLPQFAVGRRGKGELNYTGVPMNQTSSSDLLLNGENNLPPPADARWLKKSNIKTSDGIFSSPSIKYLLTNLKPNYMYWFRLIVYFHDAEPPFDEPLESPIQKIVMPPAQVVIADESTTLNPPSTATSRVQTSLPPTTTEQSQQQPVAASSPPTTTTSVSTSTSTHHNILTTLLSAPTTTSSPPPTTTTTTATTSTTTTRAPTTITTTATLPTTTTTTTTTLKPTSTTLQPTTTTSTTTTTTPPPTTTTTTTTTLPPPTRILQPKSDQHHTINNPTLSRLFTPSTSTSTHSPSTTTTTTTTTTRQPPTTSSSTTTSTTPPTTTTTTTEPPVGSEDPLIDVNEEPASSSVSPASSSISAISSTQPSTTRPISNNNNNIYNNDNILKPGIDSFNSQSVPPCQTSNNNNNNNMNDLDGRSSSASLRSMAWTDQLQQQMNAPIQRYALHPLVAFSIMTVLFTIVSYLYLKKSSRVIAPITSQSTYDNPTFTKLVSYYANQPHVLFVDETGQNYNNDAILAKQKNLEVDKSSPLQHNHYRLNEIHHPINGRQHLI